MRYVRFHFGFVLWPEGETVTTHFDMTLGVQRKAISAGFVKFENGKPVCYGESVSLRMGPRPDDSEELAQQLEGAITTPPNPGSEET